MKFRSYTSKSFKLQQFEHPDGTIGMIFSALLNCITNLFVCCYFGKMATDSYLNMSNYLYESNWFELPIALQKYYILMIGNMDKPVYYHGFGIAILNLKTFLAVREAARQLSKS